ncbi:elongation factor 1-beta [Candidatus Woesearchaeota archaeon]|nr:elongation factor 1-beta [Candidatus Woesearchaeota archaeon]
MANVVITFKIMLESPETDIDSVKDEAISKIEDYGVHVGKTEIEPIAFGLKAIKLICIMDESKGGTDDLEDQIREIDGVNSVEVVDVRRAVG